MSNQTIFTAACDVAQLAGGVTVTGSKAGSEAVTAFGQRDIASGAAMTADALFQIASMTKAITSTAALQCVERGQLSLDAPLGEILSDLDALQVFSGYGEDGQARFRPAKRRITLRHLLTHTSGMGYLFSNAELAGLYTEETMPAPGTLDSIRLPLLFDPGERWEYGVSTDWVGRAVEAVTGQSLETAFAETITGPLGMTNTLFFPEGDLRARCATLYGRDGEGGLVEMPFEIGGGREAELISGGGGLWSTAGDYARFLRMIMNGGTLDGVRILSPESVRLMSTNQIGLLGAGKMGAVMPMFALPYEQFPEMTCGWSLSFLINPEPSPQGRAAESLAWAGIANCHYWIDPKNDLFGIFLTQLLPFADPRAFDAFTAFERMAYSERKAR